MMNAIVEVVKSSDDDRDNNGRECCVTDTSGKQALKVEDG